jgi:hypothetical protein
MQLFVADGTPSRCATIGSPLSARRGSAPRSTTPLGNRGKPRIQRVSLEAEHGLILGPDSP